MKKLLSFIFLLFVFGFVLLLFNNSKAFAAGNHLLTFKADDFDIFTAADLKLVNDVGQPSEFETAVTRAGIYVPNNEATVFRVYLKTGFETNDYDSLFSLPQLAASGSVFSSQNAYATALTLNDYFEWTTNLVTSDAQINISGIKRQEFSVSINKPASVTITENSPTVEYGSSYSFKAMAVAGSRIDTISAAVIPASLSTSLTKNLDGTYLVFVYTGSGGGITGNITIDITATVASNCKVEFASSPGLTFINSATSSPMANLSYLSTGNTLNVYVESNASNNIIFDFPSGSGITQGTPVLIAGMWRHPLSISIGAATSRDLLIRAKYTGESKHIEFIGVPAGLTVQNNGAPIDYGDIVSFNVTAQAGHKLELVNPAFTVSSNAVMSAIPNYSGGVLQSYTVIVSGLNNSENVNVNVSSGIVTAQTYSVSFGVKDFPQGVNISGIGTSATYGIDFVFSISANTGYDVSSATVVCTVGGIPVVAGLTPSSNPSEWTISGSEITSNIVITISGVTYRQYNVTFRMPDPDVPGNYVLIPASAAQILANSIQLPEDTGSTSLTANVLNTTGYSLRMGTTFSFKIELQPGYTDANLEISEKRGTGTPTTILESGGAYGFTQGTEDIMIIVSGLVVNKYTITFNSAAVGLGEDSHFDRLDFFESDGITPLTLNGNAFSFWHSDQPLNIVLKPKVGYRLNAMTIGADVGVTIISQTESNCTLKIEGVTSNGTVTIDNVEYKLYNVVFRGGRLSGNNISISELHENIVKILPHPSGGSILNAGVTPVNMKTLFKFYLEMAEGYSDSGVWLCAATLAGDNSAEVPLGSVRSLEEEPGGVRVLNFRYGETDAIALPETGEYIYIIIGGIREKSYRVQLLAEDDVTANNLKVEYNYIDGIGYTASENFNTSITYDIYKGTVNFGYINVPYGGDLKLRVSAKENHMINTGNFGTSFFLTFPTGVGVSASEIVYNMQNGSSSNVAGTGDVVVSVDIILRNITQDLIYDSGTGINNAILVKGAQYARYDVSFRFNSSGDSSKIRIYDAVNDPGDTNNLAESGKTTQVIKNGTFKFKVTFLPGYTQASGNVEFTINGAPLMHDGNNVYTTSNITAPTDIDVSAIPANKYNIYFCDTLGQTYEDYLTFYPLNGDGTVNLSSEIAQGIPGGVDLEHGGTFKFAIKVKEGYDISNSEKISVVVEPINSGSFSTIGKTVDDIDQNNRYIFVTLTNITQDAKLSVYLDQTRVPIRFPTGDGVNVDFFEIRIENGTEVISPTAIGSTIQYANYGDRFRFAVRPKEGYDIGSLTVYAGLQSVGSAVSLPPETNGPGYNKYTVSNITELVTITASINILKYDVEFPAAGVDNQGGDDGIKFQFETGGSINRGQVISYDHNSSIRFRMIVDDKHNQFVPEIQVNGRPIHHINGIYSINNIKQDVKILLTENSRINTYSVTLTPREGIAYTDLPSSNIVTHGSDYSFKINGGTGYNLSNMVVVCTRGIRKETLHPNSGVYTIFNITESATITVTDVSLIDYIITFAPAAGVTYYSDRGVVLPSSVSVKHGDNFEFNIVIDDAYDESVPGVGAVRTGASELIPVSKLATGRYTVGGVEGITSNTTVSVENVSLNKYTINFTKIDGIEYQHANGTIISSPQVVNHKTNFSFKARLLPAYADSKITVMLGTQQTLTAIDGVYTIYGIVEDKLVTVGGVEESRESMLVGDINNLPDSVKDLTDVQAVINATKAYNQLPEDKKATITNINKLNALQEQVKKFHQTSNGVTVEGTDWHLKLMVVPIESNSEICGRIYKKLSSEFIISLYDIYLWDTLNERRYVLPEGQTAFITIPTPDLTYFEKPVGIHENLNGKIDYLIISIKGNTTSFEVGGFSPMGLIANRSLRPGRSSLLDAVDANINAIKNYALHNYQSSNPESGGSSVAPNPDENTNIGGGEENYEGNINEQFKSRNNKVTARGSALRLLLLLMLVVLIVVCLSIFIKNRKNKSETGS